MDKKPAAAGGRRGRPQKTTEDGVRELRELRLEDGKQAPSCLRDAARLLKVSAQREKRSQLLPELKETAALIFEEAGDSLWVKLMAGVVASRRGLLAAETRGVMEKAHPVAQIGQRAWTMREAAIGSRAHAVDKRDDALTKEGEPVAKPRSKEVRRAAMILAAHLRTPNLAKSLVGKLGERPEGVEGATFGGLFEVCCAYKNEDSAATPKRFVEGRRLQNGEQLRLNCDLQGYSVQDVASWLGFLATSDIPSGDVVTPEDVEKFVCGTSARRGKLLMTPHILARLVCWKEAAAEEVVSAKGGPSTALFLRLCGLEEETARRKVDEALAEWGQEGLGLCAFRAMACKAVAVAQNFCFPSCLSNWRAEEKPELQDGFEEKVGKNTLRRKPQRKTAAPKRKTAVKK